MKNEIIKQKALLCAEIALTKNAENIKILDLTEKLIFTDFFIICTGTSDRQLQAIADSIIEKMKKTGSRLFSSEGYTQGRWILLDFGDLIVHLFLEELRKLYQLEDLWKDSVSVPIPAEFYSRS